MPRSSFTLKRYQPLNTSASVGSDWRVFRGNVASGASNVNASSIFYPSSESFDIYIRASSPKWVPESDSMSFQILLYSGKTSTAMDRFEMKIYAQDTGVPGSIGITLWDNGVISGEVTSEPVPFIDNTPYWIKFAFDRDALTGTFSYAPYQESVPTSWSVIPNLVEDLSGVSTTAPEAEHCSIGFAFNYGNTGNNKFNGNIERVVIKSYLGVVTEYFYYTGSAATWTVPADINTVDALLWGGGRSGGQTFGTISVTPGEVFTLRVGGTNSGATGGWPNGGNGGTNSADSSYGNGGCGSSDIKIGTEVIAVAGGRGGSVRFLLSDPQVDTELSQWGARCGNGTSTGFNPVILNSPNGGNGWGAGPVGKGGNQSAGGTAGFSTSAVTTSVATAGASFQGGNGASTNASATGGYRAAGGGGGGGYFGGGGGGLLVTGASVSGYPGGGGSSYANPSRVTNTKFAVRPNSDSNMGITGTNSWRAAGAQAMNSNLWFLVPLILTDTVDGSSGTVVNGPPQPDYSLSTYNGLIALRYTD